jgi:alpha-D-ribose 1-methylphosphonate 5-triphosphate synthase subunit PhnH
MTLQLTKKHNFDIVFDSQKIFRLILEAMSNPSKVVNIKECADKLYGDYPALLAVAMTLLDNEVGFNICENRQLSDEIVSLTLSRREKIDSADFIFVCDSQNIKNAIENSKCGTLADPHKSATVIIQNNGKPTCRLKLSGPGIKDTIEIQVTQIVKEAVVLRDTQYYEYPQGIDLIFVSEAGELFAVPRLARVVQ